ncbi:MAG: Rieske (2Fe-2S) protein [Bacteroidota bacterium]
MVVKDLDRNIFQRLFGISKTTKVSDIETRKIDDGILTVYLSRIKELGMPGMAVCLEGEDMPDRILVIRDREDNYHALLNKCSHGGRKLDPVPGTDTVQCCSMGKSTFDIGGTRLSESAEEDIKSFKTELKGDELKIHLK